MSKILNKIGKKKIAGRKMGGKKQNRSALHMGKGLSTVLVPYHQLLLLH